MSQNKSCSSKAASEILSYRQNIFMERKEEGVVWGMLSLEIYLPVITRTMILSTVVWHQLRSSLLILHIMIIPSQPLYFLPLLFIV